MKNLVVLLSILAFSVNAVENRVLSGKHTEVIKNDSDGKQIFKESFIEELVLLNCNVSISSLSNDSSRKIRLSFSGSTFIANSISFHEGEDGTCVVSLGKGLRES